ncbi:MAG: T9SS C-terminal target domain-containing protein [Gemmatimonadetes bacterium]|nr:MAG: T9SS C-terminal target domain-containing protein [Gemmatimonadota bacterium]
MNRFFISFSLLVVMVFALAAPSQAADTPQSDLQTATIGVIFTDDFENGGDNWVLEPTWGIVEVSGPDGMTNALHESPDGNYGDGLYILAHTANSFDFSEGGGAMMRFDTRYDIEEGWDYCYVVASTDGENWEILSEYTGNQADWTTEEADLGYFAGEEQVWVGFLFESDSNTNENGIYIDNVQIETFMEDTTPPFISYTPPYSSTDDIPAEYVATAIITDFSGVASATLYYSVDGGDNIAVEAVVSGDEYTFEIPAVEHGAEVMYYIEAEDTEGNMASTGMYSYYSGYLLYYHTPPAEYYITGWFTGSTIAKRFTPVPEVPEHNVVQIKRVFLSLYHSVGGYLPRPVELHVWSDATVDTVYAPGDDIMTPFNVDPVDPPTIWTPVDLRGTDIQDYPSSQDFWVGYEFLYDDGPTPLADAETPGLFNRDYVLDFETGDWNLMSRDYYLQAIVSYMEGSNVEPENTSIAVPAKVELGQNYPNPFNPFTSIKYSVPATDHVSLKVYNSSGQLVKVLVDGTQEASSYTVTWDGTDELGNSVNSGVYFYTLETNNTSETKSMVLLK